MTESTGLQLLRREVIFDMAKKLTKTERSEVAKKAWRTRKRNAAGGTKKKSAAASKRSATKRSTVKRSAA